MEKNNKIDKKAENENVVKIIVFRSNAAIYAQAFNLSDRKVIASSSSLKITKKKPVLAAKEVGEDLAKKIIKQKVKFVFDRNGYLYHGQVKALAEGLRKGGIKI